MCRWFHLLTIFLTACNAQIEAPPPAPESRIAVREPDGPVILAFGNSLTAGHGVLPSESFPARLQQMLIQRGYKHRVVNQGISGDTTSGGLARMDAALAMKPFIVILELGANDGLRGLPVANARRNLQQMIVQFQQAGATVVLAGMTLPRNYGLDFIREFERMYVDLSAQFKTALIPFFLDGVAARSDLVLEDGIHPNGDGYAIVTENVFRTIEPYL